MGVSIGWVLGHWLHDSIGRVYARRHGGRIQPEARLIPSYLASMLLVPSLIVLGFGLQQLWHYMVIAVFAAIQACAGMILVVSLNAYLLDCYPDRSGDVGAWVAFARLCGAFTGVLVELPWVARDGVAQVLCTQAGLTGAAALIVAFLQIYGGRLRRFQATRKANGNRSS